MNMSFDPSQVAFSKAIDEFRANLQDDATYSDILRTTSIQQVYDATDKLQEDQAKNGHLRHLSKIEPYLTRLSEYADAVGVFIQAKPEILALLWGPVVLLLQCANALKKSFDAIVDTTAEVGLALPDFQRAVELFKQSSQIKDVLLLFFRDVTKQLINVFQSCSGWKYVFEALWPKHRDKIKVVTTNIERHTLLMRKEVQFEHIQQEHEARLRSLAHFESTEKAHQCQEFYTIRTDMSPQTYDAKLNELHSRTCVGTGNWLLKDADFMKWLNGSESGRLLWLQGIPGAGKTFLAGIAVDKALERGRSLFAFISYTHASNTSALSILHSLIFQLAADEENLQIVLCQLDRKNFKSNTKIALEILSSLLAYAGTVYIVIDGLDEMDEIERGILVKNLQDILKRCGGVRILISSRPEADLKSLLGGQTPSIRVDNQNAGSIQMFVRHWTRNWFEERQFSSQARAAIEGWLAPLASKSKGMFLYAKVILNSIEYLDDMNEIGVELNVLPESLDAAYARILLRVNNLQPPRSKEHARKLLGWIACSPTPLMVQEVRQALTVKLDDRVGGARLLADLNLQKICGPIIEVDDEYIQFVHFTVKEYLSSPNIPGYISEADSTLSLTMTCIAYLCQQHHELDLPSEEITENTLAGIYILHKFAATNWLELLERSVQLSTRNKLPPGLISLMEVLLSDRTNYNYDDKGEDMADLKLATLKDKTPQLHDMASRALHFRKACSASQYRMQESVWTNLDPLTISQTSLLIHKTVDSLLDCKAQEHNTSCSCHQIRRHYGSRPFKCSFVNCRFCRLGFGKRRTRNSHEKFHDRPWKCSVPTCEYADGGFLSRKMRDNHLDEYHQRREPQEHSIVLMPDPDEVQPLLFDLVQADNFDAVKALLPSFVILDWPIQFELLKITAASGSGALLKLLLQSGTKRNYLDGFDLPSIAITNNNISTFEYLLQQVLDPAQQNVPNHHYIPRAIVSDTLGEVLRSDSMDIYDMWEKYVDFEFQYHLRIYKTQRDGRERLKRARFETKSSVAISFTDPRHLSSIQGHPHREQLVYHLWKNKGIIKALNSEDLGRALAHVARSCCSVRLAKCLIEAGAKVDHRRSVKYMTPLHYAASSSTAEAAELMRFLLLSGANPNAMCKGTKQSIRDKKGAKGISKWLGISFDELVVQTKKEREEREAQADSGS